MRKLIFAVTFFVLAPFVFLITLMISLVLYRYQPGSFAISANSVAYAALPTTQNVISADITQSDGRKEKVRQFLAAYNSPLEPYADDIVDAADEYGLDHRLVPAIAMQESNLCKVIPVDSYNCWGFGIYGKTITRFPNYKEAIYTVTKTLATKYKGQGLITPEEIMTMYTPSSNGSWAFSVRHFMEKLQ